jgi:serine/threonine-protein kinase
VTKAADADGLIGRYIGGYRIVRELGRGGMGTVYLAENDVIGERRAIKVLARWAEEDRGPASLRERFIQEAKAAAKIKHPNIVPVMDISAFADGRLYLEMPFIDGKEMNEHCRAMGLQWGHPGRIPADMAWPLVAQILSALRATHERGIIHRDLKSENIIVGVGPSGGKSLHVYILDFGIAKLLDPELRVLRGVTTQLVLGTPGYMSPEQARGQLVDHRTDIYAIGVVLYRMLTGRAPFDADSSYDLIDMQLHRPPPAPIDLVPNIPPVWSEMTMKCLAPEPDDRPDGAAELAVHLMRAIPHGYEVARDVAKDLVIVLSSADPTVRGPHTPPGAIPILSTPPPLPPGSERPDAVPTLRGSSSGGQPPPAAPLRGLRVSATPSPSLSGVARPVSAHGTAAPGAVASARPSVVDAPRFSAVQRRVLAITVVLVAVAVAIAALVSRMNRKDDAEGSGLDAAVIVATPVDASISGTAISPADAAPAPVAAAAPPADARPSDPTTKMPRPRTHEPSRSDAPGKLTVKATPWADVTIDGKDAGTTPVNVELSPGKHTVRLSPPEGDPETRTIRIKSGEVTTVNRNYE